MDIIDSVYKLIDISGNKLVQSAFLEYLGSEPEERIEWRSFLSMLITNQINSIEDVMGLEEMNENLLIELIDNKKNKMLLFVLYDNIMSYELYYHRFNTGAIKGTKDFDKLTDMIKYIDGVSYHKLIGKEETNIFVLFLINLALFISLFAMIVIGIKLIY